MLFPLATCGIAAMAAMLYTRWLSADFDVLHPPSGPLSLSGWQPVHCRVYLRDSVLARPSPAAAPVLNEPQHATLWQPLAQCVQAVDSQNQVCCPAARRRSGYTAHTQLRCTAGATDCRLTKGRSRWTERAAKKAPASKRLGPSSRVLVTTGCC